MKVRAPGKLILSGEHAVVHGCPVLVTALDRYATLSLKAKDETEFTLKLQEVSFEHVYPLQYLFILNESLRKKYKDFQQNKLSIREVLTHPVDLILFAISLLLEKNSSQFKNGFDMQLQSDIPIGCGMGSSAAIIMSVLYAFSEFFAFNLQQEELIRLGLEAEHLQHGHSSGIDLRISTVGGTIFLQHKQADLERRVMLPFPLFIVDTGQPSTTTGECVMATSMHFKKSKMMDDFTAVTKAMDHALNKNFYEFVECIRENHRLLSAIGAVPEKVHSFITKIEETQGAAKICGAGAVAGDSGGMVLVAHEDEKMLQYICSQFHYPVEPLRIASRGVHVY